MRHNAVALLAGMIFAVGLAVSGMTQPSKVIGFLDFTGAWDASLAFVMIGAIGLNLLVFRRALRRSGPILGGRFHLPERNDIEPRLVIGAALFGIGWGIAGYCPGPGLVSLVSGSAGPIVFVVAMIAGIVLHHLFEAVLSGASKHEADASS
ncbi:Hypothetical protein A7982_04699 [Minicystis rosea]|nr:Hypothetical protein A7982_04699 [Minicystis rosea]